MTTDIDQFLSALGNLDEQLPHSSFNYASVESNGRRYLLIGRLFINAFPSPDTFQNFEHGSVRVGKIPFGALGLNTRELISHLFDGVLPIDGNIHFPKPNPEYKINYHPAHAAGGRVNKLTVLQIEGVERSKIIAPDLLDWEVRGAETPYDNFIELLGENRLGFQGPNSAFEIVLNHLVEVDHKSRVFGETAKIGVYLSSNLPKGGASIGYRVFAKERVISRGRVNGDDLTWTEEENHSIGCTEIGVPPAAIVHLVASYNGVAQYSYYVSDPEHAPNDRRSIYENFDAELVLLKEWLFRPMTKGANARDFEAAVSWLFWMIGFSPVLLGLFPKTQDASDMIVVTPRGNYAVVECTVGMLRADNKLATLVRRSNELKDRLRAAGSGHLNVLPIMVTSLTREGVAAELEQAERAGVVVVTRETLGTSIERTLLPLQPDKYYDDALRTTAESAAKYTS